LVQLDRNGKRHERLGITGARMQESRRAASKLGAQSILPPCTGLGCVSQLERRLLQLRAGFRLALAGSVRAAGRREVVGCCHRVACSLAAVPGHPDDRRFSGYGPDFAALNTDSALGTCPLVGVTPVVVPIGS